MRKIIVGIALAAGMLAASLAHAVSAYLPVEYAETAPNGAYRLKVSASTDSTYLQQYMGGTWTTRTAWKNGERALNDLPVSSDSSISRVGTGSPTSPKRYKLNHGLFSSDSTITRTGGAFTKKYTVSKTVTSMNADSSLDRSGNNTATTPVKLKVELASIVNADSSLKITGTPSATNPKRFKVNPAMMTRAQSDSTLDTSGDATPASPKLLGVNLATNFPWTGTHTWDGVPGSLVLSANITFEDDTVAVGTIPAGAIITGVLAHVNVVFNAGTTNVLTCGGVGTEEAYVAGASLNEASATLQPVVGTASLAAALVSPLPLKLFYTQTGSAATTGSARVSIHFYMP